jgi:hypothetical protein
MGGEVAGPFCPLHRGLTISLAVGASLVIHHSITPFAGFYDGITSPTVVGTAALLHEDALCPHFDRLTNHGAQPPSLWIKILTRPPPVGERTSENIYWGIGLSA